MTRSNDDDDDDDDDCPSLTKKLKRARVSPNPRYKVPAINCGGMLSANNFAQGVLAPNNTAEQRASKAGGSLNDETSD
jgi:hypothetical protein